MTGSDFSGEEAADGIGDGPLVVGAAGDNDDAVDRADDTDACGPAWG
ncbi:hypothetical protein [Geodermatophilus sp. DF01-2]|nr:hypothetical protein [Geodermatophilus sp. DF01_2]